MRHYATLFDRNYLAKGLCLYESLKRHSSEPFWLSVLAMDVETGWILDELNLPEVDILPVATFERVMNLQAVRANRTWQEYAWTCASQLMEYLLRPTIIEDMTYLDSDVYFFSDPKVIFDELGLRSIGITPHRLIPSKKHLEVNGRFNVGVVVARNTDAGRHCMSTWAAECRERCSAEVGCGDQKYLDQWQDRYGDNVCVFENVGVNAGPWSIGNWTVTEGPKLDGVPLVAYHFHEFIKRDNGNYRLTNYALTEDVCEWIYAPYIDAYDEALKRIALAEERIKGRRHQTAMQAERA